MLPLITLDRLNLHLAGRHILHDITWSLVPGDHWAFVGPNGCGKSTLLRVLAGKQWIDDGSVRRYSPDGVRADVVARAAGWIRHLWAEGHERYARLDLASSARTIVASGFDDSLYLHRPLEPHERERVDTLLEEFRLADIAGRPLRELSSGQFRRVLIARAVTVRPRVLILDEFTNGLDRRAREDVLTLLDGLAAHVALVIASHRAGDFPASINRTAVLTDGRIAALHDGRPRAIPVTAAIDSGPARAIGGLNATALPPRDGDVLFRLENADVYRGATLVLDRVSWELRRGQHTEIRGANGAGKSTLAGVIAGTIAPATGSGVERFGRRGPFDIWQLKDRIAVLSDDLQTAYDARERVENVIASGFTHSIGLFAHISDAQRAAVSGLLERVGLTALRDRPITELSYGQRRAVLIARSLVRRPDIFILDEAWNGLDAAFAARLRELLTELVACGTTLVSIAHVHDGELLVTASRVCTIENRSIREMSGSPPHDDGGPVAEKPLRRV